MNKGIIAGVTATAFLTLAIATPVHAYIGPGAGAGVVAVVLGLIGSIFLLFLGILWYPFKRLLRLWRKKAKSIETDIAYDDKLDPDNNSLCHCDRTGPEVTVQKDNNKF